MHRKKAGVVEDFEDSVEELSDNEVFWPTSFKCPITAERFKAPIVTDDGHSYEEADLNRWMRQSRNKRYTSPNTGLPLQSRRTRPNHQLKQAIDEYEEKVVPQLKKMKVLEKKLFSTQLELEKTKKRAAEKESKLQEELRVLRVFISVSGARTTEKEREAQETLERERSLRRDMAEREERLREDMQAMAVREELLEKNLALLGALLDDETPGRWKNKTLQNDSKPKVSHLRSSSLFSKKSSQAITEADEALKQAVTGYNMDKVMLALRQGANVNVQFGSAKKTAVMLAIELYPDYTPIIRDILIQLFKKKPDFNLTTAYGENVLHLAVCHSSLWLVKVLLEAGANPLLRDGYGRIPRDIVSRSTHPGKEILVNLLKEYEDRFEAEALREASPRFHS